MALVASSAWYCGMRLLGIRRSFQLIRGGLQKYR